MDKKIKILHVVTILDVGGIETTLMNYLRYMNKDIFQFDFLVHREAKGHFDDEVKALGGNIFYAPSFSLKNIFRYNKFINSFFKNHSYDIVHSHLDALSYFPLKGALNNGIKVRVAHSHVNNFDIGLTYPIREIFKRMIPLSATSFMACSIEAGNFMFPGKKFDILLNPIDTEKFKFDSDVREKLKTDLNIGNKTVIGHVGRFDPAKNHRFILQLAELLDPNKYYFLLVGTGPLLPEIKREASERSISNVNFLGVRDNVPDYLSVMDIFILPSFYEGLGIAAVEAQVSGLYTIVSSAVSNDALLTDNIISLDLNLSRWEKAILGYKKLKREDINKNLALYDVEPNTKKLENAYKTLLEDKL